MNVLPKLNVMTLTWATDWAEIFGRERPLILEIGFGRGAFLLHLARTNPEHNVIGIEISNRCLVTTENAIQREGLTNVRVVYSMAETALSHLFTPQSLSQIHINFPDPWFRTRHSHRRLMQRDTLDAIVSRLQTGGLLYLATDIIDYAEMSHEILRDTPGLTNLLPSAWADHIDGRIVTKYEATARREGRDCYYFAYQRNDTPAPFVPVIQEMPMPHIVFKSEMTLEDVETRFQPFHRQNDDGIFVNVLRVWRSGRHLLFETHVKETTIEQRVALTLSARDDGAFTLQLSTLGHPRPTTGVHFAVGELAHWLLAIHPDATLITSKLQDDL